jgi:superfamily I DNA and/or RNA helicase
MTVCNAISNLCTIFPSKKILAVCPSDAAADVILTRLARQFGPKIMFRLHWWQRGVASVPIETLRFCHQIDDKFEIPSFEDICEFQIIITTCFCAGSLRHLQSAMNKIHSHEVCLEFDVVIVDEASQASEAETYVPLSLCKQIGLIVLAGDTQQLGPVYRSPAYRDKAISSSLEARLLDTKTYRFLNHLKDVEEDSIDELLLSIHKGDDMAPDSDIVSHRLKNNLGVFLNQNYRSHQVIFEVSSLLFYNSSLEQCGNEEILSLTKWSYLPQTKQFPVLVFGVKGTHKHVIDSPSYYNMDEGNAVVELLTSLLTENIAGERVKQKDIGIIAAFRSQVLLIRTLFRKHKMSNVSVGSVEDFQGNTYAYTVLRIYLRHVCIL